LTSHLISSLSKPDSYLPPEKKRCFKEEKGRHMKMKTFGERKKVK
jgi:hypothetical protein